VTSNLDEAKSPKAGGTGTDKAKKGKKKNRSQKGGGSIASSIQESPIFINEEVPIHIRSLKNPHFVMCGSN
jgi:hypothetical protein